MFNRKQKDNPKLDEVIELALDAVDPYDDEYLAKVEGVERLMKLKDNEKSSRRISPDTLAIVAGNLAGIILIVGYEKANIVTSKATGFILKAR